MLKDYVDVEFFAVGVGAFLGVTTRVGLSKAFQFLKSDSCGGFYGSLAEVLGYQNFLISNILGCMVISFCISFSSEINRLSKPLFKMLTSGFCGSLTTFSGWMVNTSYNAVYGGWFGVMVMISIQFALTWVGLELGIALANFCKEHAIYCGQSLADGVDDDDNNHNNNNHNNDNNNNNNSINNTDISNNGNNGNRFSTLEHSLDIEMGHSEDDHAVQAIVTANELAHQTEIELWCWGILLFITAGVVWLLAIIESLVVFINGTTEKVLFRSIVVAPFGAWARWGVSKIPSIMVMYPKMNPQTFFVNQIGVLVGILLKLIVDDPWKVPISTGMVGSFTTVSTLFVELQTLYKENGVTAAYRYGMLTFGVAFMIVQLVCVAANSQ